MTGGLFNLSRNYDRPDLCLFLSEIRFKSNVNSKSKMSGKERNISAMIESGGRRRAKIKEPR